MANQLSFQSQRDPLKKHPGLQKTRHKIPIKVSEQDFKKYFLPHLTTFTRGFVSKIPLFKIFNYILYCLHTGCQWEQIPIDKDKNGKPEIHYTNIFKRFQVWANDGSLAKCFINSVRVLHQKKKLRVANLHGDGSNTVAKRGGEKIGYSGYKHQKGDKIIPITEDQGYILAALNIRPVNESDCVLLADSLDELMRISREVGFSLKSSTLNLDKGFDSRQNRKLIQNRGLRANIPENARNRKNPKRGRPRFYDRKNYKKRFKIERTFGWEDKFRRLVIRYEKKQQNHLGFKLLAYTLINLRKFIKSQ